jgi:hypothetical protein
MAKNEPAPPYEIVICSANENRRRLLSDKIQQQLNMSKLSIALQSFDNIEDTIKASIVLDRTRRFVIVDAQSFSSDTSSELTRLFQALSNFGMQTFATLGDPSSSFNPNGYTTQIVETNLSDSEVKSDERVADDLTDLLMAHINKVLPTGMKAAL